MPPFPQRRIAPIAAEETRAKVRVKAALDSKTLEPALLFPAGAPEEVAEVELL